LWNCELDEMVLESKGLALYQVVLAINVSWVKELDER